MPLPSSRKSPSKRGTRNFNVNSGYNSAPKPPSQRKRSQSVSAVSRTKQQLDISSEFSNKRENPLFGTSPSSPTCLEGCDGIDHSSEITLKKIGGDGGQVDSTIEKASDTTGDRGRSATRNGSYGVRNGIGRSLSRDRGGPVSARYLYETGNNQEMVAATNIHNNDANFANNSRQTVLVRKGSNKCLLTRNHREAADCSEEDDAYCFQISNWENGTSVSSLPEAEERTIKAVCKQNKLFGADYLEGETGMSGIYETVRLEVRRAISEIQDDLESALQRSKVSGIATKNISEIPPDFVNPGAVDVVLDIRRAYAIKLEESEKRSRKLREDLAIEEHRRQELSRILKEVLHDPETSNFQKSRLGRKRSSERKKISKRLTEEAMAYFEECVSISTFDSSDFSAPGEPAYGSAAPSMCDRLQENWSINSPPYTMESCSNQQVQGGQDEVTHSCDESKLTGSSTSSQREDTVYQLCKEKGISQQHLFSLAQKTEENLESHNINSFMNNCRRESSLDRLSADITGLGYNAVDLNLHGCVDSLLFDRVFFRNRVESGGLHLCSGFVAFPFSPFGSII